MELVTARLRLRRAELGDLESMHEILSDRRAMRFWSTAPHRDLEQTRAWLAAMVADGPPLSDDFVIEHDGRVIGKAGAWRVPEIGFVLHPDYWGQGLAGEAVAAVIAHVFASYDVDAITAEADPRNDASVRLLKRLGFLETGFEAATYEIEGEVSDSVYLALARARALGGPPAGRREAG